VTWDDAMREHEARLKPGVLVRIRCAECDSHWHAGGDWDGAVGTINDVEPSEEEARHAEPNRVGHRYFVHFWDDVGGMFAAAELIVVASEASGPGGSMPSEVYLDSIAESVTQCRWVVEQHTGRGEGRKRCAICETWWPCDLVSVAATAVLLADRLSRPVECPTSSAASSPPPMTKS